MKGIVLSLSFLFIIVQAAFAQIPVWDVLFMEAQIDQNKKEFERHVDLRDNQVISTATQAKAKEEGKKFEEKVKIIHDRLTSLGELLADGKMAFDAYAIAKDIIKYQSRVQEIIQNNPELIPVGLSSEIRLVDRATMLIRYIGLMIISASDINAMKTSDRRMILKHLMDELRLIRGEAYGLANTLKWAKEGGLLNLLNPWSKYVNEDKRLAEDILRNLKY